MAIVNSLLSHHSHIIVCVVRKPSWMQLFSPKKNNCTVRRLHHPNNPQPIPRHITIIFLSSHTGIVIGQLFTLSYCRWHEWILSSECFLPIIQIVTSSISVSEVVDISLVNVFNDDLYFVDGSLITTQNNNTTSTMKKQETTYQTLVHYSCCLHDLCSRSILAMISRLFWKSTNLELQFSEFVDLSFANGTHQ